MKSRFINNTVCGLAVTTLLLGAAGAARADGHATLKQELRVLTERLQELEAKLAQTEEKVDETRDRAILATGRSPGSFLIPGTNTEFSISGYVKADFIYDLKQAQGGSISASGLAVVPPPAMLPPQDKFQAHARQSRIRISTSTPTPLGDLNAVIETDFFGAGGNQNQSNSYGMRLRNAYVEIGGLLVGQYWTNFGTLNAVPGTLDFGGPAGYTFIRQAQVRWTQSIDDKLRFAVSLENPEARQRACSVLIAACLARAGGAGVIPALGFVGPPFFVGSRFLDRLPDAVAALEYNDDWGQVRFSVLGRQLTTPDGRQSALGYGINIGGTFAAWLGGNILANFTYGDGIGRYLIDGVGEGAFYGFLPGRAGPVLETKSAYGIVLGANHRFTDTVMGQLAWGRYEIEDAMRLSAPFKRVTTLHASLFWSPLSRLTFGGEVIYYERENVNGAESDNVRLQTSVQVSF